MMGRKAIVAPGRGGAAAPRDAAMLGTTKAGATVVGLWAAVAGALTGASRGSIGG